MQTIDPALCKPSTLLCAGCPDPSQSLDWPSAPPTPPASPGEERGLSQEWGGSPVRCCFSPGGGGGGNKRLKKKKGRQEGSRVPASYNETTTSHTTRTAFPLPVRPRPTPAPSQGPCLWTMKIKTGGACKLDRRQKSPTHIWGCNLETLIPSPLPRSFTPRQAAPKYAGKLRRSWEGAHPAASSGAMEPGNPLPGAAPPHTEF